MAGSLWLYGLSGFIHSVSEEIQGAGPCRGAFTGFKIASGSVLSEEYGHGGPGVCLGDGQTAAEGVPSQSGRGV